MPALPLRYFPGDERAITSPGLLHDDNLRGDPLVSHTLSEEDRVFRSAFEAGSVTPAAGAATAVRLPAVAAVAGAACPAAATWMTRFPSKHGREKRSFCAPLGALFVGLGQGAGGSLILPKMPLVSS